MFCYFDVVCRVREQLISKKIGAWVRQKELLTLLVGTDKYLPSYPEKSLDLDEPILSMSLKLDEPQATCDSMRIPLQTLYI